MKITVLCEKIMSRSTEKTQFLIGGTAQCVSSVRSVFRARIVFDFRPIKVDSAHRPVFRGADTPGGPLSAGWIRTFGSRGRAQYPVPDLSRGLLADLSSLSLLATPRNII